MTGMEAASDEQRTSLYKQYKEASSSLLFWIVNTYNRLLDDLSSSKKNITEPLPPRKTSGQVSPAEIVSLSWFIGQHGVVPPAVCSLLHNIILLRSETADNFDKDLEQNPTDDRLRKGNATHRHFIGIHKEVCGSTPRLALNSVAVALSAVTLFDHIHSALIKAGKSHQDTPPPTGDIVNNIVTAVETLRDQDDTTLRNIAGVFEKESYTFLAHAYWKDFISEPNVLHRAKRTNPALPPEFDESSCVVM